MHGSQLNIFIFLITNFFYLENIIESSPVQKISDQSNSPVVYRRYVRKGPSIYEGDIYMEDVHEIFEIRRRPPQFSIFNDNEIDQLIRCDFEPHLKECENLLKKEQNLYPVLPTLPTKRTSTTTSATTSTKSIKLIPIPTRTTLKPYKPTPAVDLNPPQTNEIEGIPTLPPDSEEYVENIDDSVEYEEGTSDDDSKVTENDDQNNENNEVDEEDGYDF